MKHASIYSKSLRQNSSLSQHRPVTGPSGVSIAPPAYGIDFVDQQQSVGVRANAARVPIVQAKLVVGRADDEYEREADLVAKHVLSQTSRRQRDEDEETLQRKPDIGRVDHIEGSPADPNVHQGIQQARGTGRVIPEHVRAPVEKVLGADFNAVRLHTDTRADDLSRTLGARAFTIGQDIFFRRGAYSPESRAGQGLLAHELAHVVQQRDRRYDRECNKTMQTWGGNEGSQDVVRRFAEEYIPRGDELYNKVTSEANFQKITEGIKGTWCYAAVEHIYRDMTGKWEGFGDEFEKTQEGIARRYWTSRHDELGGWGMSVASKDQEKLKGLEGEKLQEKERELKIERSVWNSFGEATMPGANVKEQGSMSPTEIINIINNDGIIFVGDTLHWQVIYGYKRHVEDEQGANEFSLYIWDVTGNEKVWDYYDDYKERKNLTHMW